MMPSYTTQAQFFSKTYSEARQKFANASVARGAEHQQFFMADQRGLLGEQLSIDTAYLGIPNPRKLLIVSSGTHGPEGFCGSGCQVSMLNDNDLLDRLARAGVGLLLAHALNPYGFSHGYRTNEDNIDLNRNFIDFDAPFPSNPQYLEVESFLLPPQWPPSTSDDERQQEFVRQYGQRALQQATSSGQWVSPKGLFYGGTAPSWSNLTVRAILRQYGVEATAIAWIDVHTGLGPYGHGEKIYAGNKAPQDIARARACWGSDVLLPFSGAESASIDVVGSVSSSLRAECPDAETACIALEYGTLPSRSVRYALRYSTWTRARGDEVPETIHASARKGLKEAFYCDNDIWKGMILGQARTAFLQVAQTMSTQR